LISKRRYRLPKDVKDISSNSGGLDCPLKRYRISEGEEGERGNAHPSGKTWGAERNQGTEKGHPMRLNHRENQEGGKRTPDGDDPIGKEIRGGGQKKILG